MASRRSTFTRLGAAVGATTLAVVPLVAPAASAAPMPTPPPAATGPAVATTGGISWQRCMGMQCGELQVPLDHAHPERGTITLSMARRPADRPSQKKGVVFVNPGGPGGSAAASVPMFAQILGRDVRRNFDIVGIDPRGVGGSDLAVCEGTPGQQPVAPDQIFPWKDEHVAAFQARDRFLAGLCLHSKPKILAHMTTADVARDMDLVRAAMGQKKIDYYGVSYGSYLGATYANLFPQRVRTMTIDGVIDPIAWATGRGGEAKTVPTTTRLRSDIGAQEALMAAISECENVGARFCAQHDDVREDWAALSTRLRDKEVTLGAGDESVSLTYDLLVALTLGSLYDPEAVPDLMTMIHEFRTVVDQNPSAVRRAAKTRLARAHTRVIERDRDNRHNRIAYDPPAVEEAETPMWMPAFEGVVCSETRNPSDRNAWISAGKAADRRAPGFGPLWTWSSSVCAGVPNAPSAYHGPFTATPGDGMLVMTTKHDPATPYRGAAAMHALSPKSRMVTVDGWGHATLDTSGCATRIRTRYIVTGTLPAKDRVCAPDHDLFTPLD